jgi:hypothetical protein
MSISQYIQAKTYIVTVKDSKDLEDLYTELEVDGVSPPNTDLKRPVRCIARIPNSRNTMYRLTDWEAAELRNDIRIKNISIVPYELGIQAGTTFVTQTSTAWDKSTGNSSTMKNWGLLRCVEGSQRSGWGGTGWQGNGSGTAAQTGTITLSQTGRNVDVVIVDSNGIVFDHPDYAVNEDGTGGSRAIQYNWFQHQGVVGGVGGSTYTYPVNAGSHSTHVAGTVAGNTQGWARSANIYNIYYYAGDIGNTNFPFVMDYVREFHRTKSVNPETGRKNPTICNNSWGMSLFSSDWSFSDITAVTYRGVRYTPAGGANFTGFSGVCTSNVRLVEMQGLENAGNRITTEGAYIPPGGFIDTIPLGWTQEGQQAYFINFAQPVDTYGVTVQGPADISVLHNVAIDAISGTYSLNGSIVVKDSGDNIVQTITDGPYSTTDGGTLETNISQTINLSNNEIYTIEYNTDITISGGVDPLFAVAFRLTVNTESAPATASVSSITNSLLGAESLTSSTTPTVGSNDDGYWTLNLPFNVQFLGTNYYQIFVGTNFYLTFGGGSSLYSNLDADTPNFPKIMMCAADRSMQRIYYGTEGSSPFRTFRVRLEGHTRVSGGVLGSPTMVAEYVFYENIPNQIDLQVGTNDAKQSVSGFSSAQLNAWGFISAQRIPVRVDALDSDLEDAFDEGIIMVGAAGNGRWKHDVPGGIDWDNTFEMANRYPASVSQPYYYMRGTSPTANDNTVEGIYDLPNICVGAVDSIQIDQKVLFSDCGPGVDIWAPGTYIMSSYTTGATDPRSGSYRIGKISGTSMASPQVCGVLACALEIYPNMTQEEAKAYIIAYAKENQLTTSSGGPTDGQDLQGAPNLFLFYHKEREESGNIFPRRTTRQRPTSGAVYPRQKIRIKG